MPVAFSSVFNSIICTRQLFVNITCHILIDPDKGNRRIFVSKQWRKLVVTTLRAGYSVSIKFSQGLTKPRSKLSWIMLNLLSEHSVCEQCQEGRKLAMKGIYLIKTTLPQRLRKALWLRKTAVWVRPRVNNRPLVFLFTSIADWN